MEAIIGPRLYPIVPLGTVPSICPAWKPSIRVTFGLFMAPSLIIGSAPPGYSSPGWKINFTVPENK